MPSYSTTSPSFSGPHGGRLGGGTSGLMIGPVTVVAGVVAWTHCALPLSALALGAGTGAVC